MDGMSLPASLVESIERAGYFPATALNAIRRAVGEVPLSAYLVRPETTFDGPEVRRHLTVLALSHNHLYVIHLDDEIADALNPMQVVVSTERVRLSRLDNIALAQVFDTDGSNVSDSLAEITIGLSWGGHTRIELERAWCDDPECQADHGLTGTSQKTDLMVRVSARAEGSAAVEEALHFFEALNRSVD